MATMKIRQYIVSLYEPVDNSDEFLELKNKLDASLNLFGGQVLKMREGGYMILVETSLEGAIDIKKIKGVEAVDENHQRVIPRPHLKHPK